MMADLIGHGQRSVITAYSDHVQWEMSPAIANALAELITETLPLATNGDAVDLAHLAQDLREQAELVGRPWARCWSCDRPLDVCGHGAP